MNPVIKYLFTTALILGLSGCATNRKKVEAHTAELNRIASSYTSELVKAETDEEIAFVLEKIKAEQDAVPKLDFERFAWFKGFLRSPKVRETALIAARKTAIAAGMAVIQAGIGQLDKENKAHFVQGLSQALWTQVPSVVNSATVEEIARVWTPDKSHWEDLAKALAADFEEKKPRSKEEAQAILHAYAEGLYLATEVHK